MPIEKYGQKWIDGALDLHIELECFKEGRPPSKGGLGKYRHFRNVCKILWPDLVWNEWLIEQIRSLCGAYHGGPKPIMNVSWTGCGASGKTFAASLFTFVFWLAGPKETIGILTSTTGQMIRSRAWPVIQDLYHRARQNIAALYKVDIAKVDCGNLVDSRTILQSQKGDDKFAIKAIAVREGPLSKAVANIQGQHAPRMIVVIDEATDTPEAIMATIPNLRKACHELIVLVTGNATLRLNPHGRACEPVNGYGSISRTDTHWETRGVPEWMLDPGICLHFAGSQSPNVKAGKTLYTFIYTWEDYQNALKFRGEETLAYWQMDEGFWPPDGYCNTIFTETMIDKYDLKGTHVFLSYAKPIMGVDPGFGGDPGFMACGLMGDLPNGLVGIQLTAMVEIRLKATSKDEYETQIAMQTSEECKKRKVDDDCFGMDATAIGRGAFGSAKDMIGPNIQRVEFGGSPSDRPSSAEDPRPSNEVYDRQVTELWYSCREFAISSQLKGLDRETLSEFCSREYTRKNKKYSIEDKDEFKARFKASPNRADAVAVMVEVARRKGAMARGVGSVGNTREEWVAKNDEINQRYEEADYSEPEALEDAYEQSVF